MSTDHDIADGQHGRTREPLDVLLRRAADWRDRPADSPIWWGEIGDGDRIIGYVAQATAHFQRWNEVLSAFTAGPASEELCAALRAAHDRHFVVATTAFAAAALAKGWKLADVDNALEMGDAWEHVYEWMWDALGFRENEEMDAFLARLVTGQVLHVPAVREGSRD
jgi:hypothetical protein